MRGAYFFSTLTDRTVRQVHYVYTYINIYYICLYKPAAAQRSNYIII